MKRPKRPEEVAGTDARSVTQAGKRVPAIFFRTETGREPVRDWLKSLPYPDDSKRLGEDIKTVEFGWPIGMPVCRPLGTVSMKSERISRTIGLRGSYSTSTEKAEWSCSTAS
jgi:hypothetical protein